VTFASIPSSVLNLVDPTKRLKITAIAGGGATEGTQSKAIGGWGQMRSAYHRNPKTTITINIGKGSRGCVKGGDTKIGKFVSLRGGRARCTHVTYSSGHSATSGITNINAGNPGRKCDWCYGKGAGGYVKIEVE
jgi:hypothetical protein